MKKITFTILLMLGITPVVCNAEEPLSLSIKTTTPGDNNGNGGFVHPKSPFIFPSVAIDGYTLYLYSCCDNTTIRLISSDETAVFSTSVEVGTDTLALPESLTGEYRLEIVRGSITFYCYIEL